MIQYFKIPIDDEGNYDTDCLTKIEDNRIPVIVQKSALQNKLISIGSKKTALQRNINDLSDDEQDILAEIEKMNLVLDS